MWDTLVRDPRGRNTMRKFSRVLAAFLVVSFGYLLATAPSASALEPTWEGDNIIYDGNEFIPYPKSAPLPSGITEDQPTYHYIDTSTSPRQIHFISFPAGSS